MQSPESRSAESKPSRIVNWLLWPFVVGSSLAVYGLANGPAELSPDFAVLVQFTYLVAVIFILEQRRPFHMQWNRYDRQLLNDLLYNVVFPAAQLVATIVSLYVLRLLSDHQASPVPIWPLHWPVLVQLLLLVPFLDLVFYSIHRAFHQWPVLWRLHSIHHSSLQLHIVNNARLHPVEVAVTFAPVVLIVHLLGVDLHVFGWFLAFQQAVGLMTHGNVRVRTGWIGLLINTPEQHHWHHSRIVSEGNSNFGSVTMIWDHLFGSFLRSRSRSASPDIGTETIVPESFFGQMLAPWKQTIR